MAATCVAVRMMEAAVSGLLEQDLSEGELGETIRALREHGALRGEASSAAVSVLLSCCTSRLSSASTRTEGLSLLSLVLEESSTDVFQQHCVSWIRSVLQVIQSQDPPRVVSLAVFVLRSLLAHSSTLPELSREISTNHIPGLLTSLLGLRRQCLMPALEGIRSCLISYPRACGSLRGKLTAFVLSLLDDENLQIQELACQCFSLLPSLGSGFSQGVKHTENWERQIQSVLCSLHATFQQLYQAAETDTTRYEGPGTELDLPVLEDDGPSSILQLVRRFTALGQCVRMLLREHFPAPVRVPASDILNLVCRVVNVSAKNLSWQGEEALKMLLLPRVHKGALDILEAAILACGPRLLAFSSVICRLFPQLLSSWASVRSAGGFPSGQEKPYSSLRGSVYLVVERWVTMCGVSSGILQGMSHHSDILLAHLLSDITPPADSVKMSGFVQLGAKKQKVSEVGNGEFQSHRKRENSANTELCTAALRALCCIILYGGSLIKEDTHRRLQELSIPLLIRLQQGPDQWIGPYTNSECRKQLYRLLLSLTLSPNPRLPPPLHCAIRIFRMGLTEENMQVSMFCTEALSICRVIIHPRVPSLQRPLPQHGPRPPMQADVPVQRPSAPPLTFPAALPLNHLPIRTPILPQPTEPPSMPLVHSPQETFGGKTPRPIFIHYEKEEMSDVEISLESDSDDSVVIVPEGLLQKPVPNSEPSPPSAKPPTEETPTTEVPVQPVVPSPTSVAAPPPPPPCPGPSPAQMPVAAELPPPLPPPLPAPAPSEGDMVININSTDEEEDDDEDEEGMYDEDEEEYYDEEEDLEGLDEDEEFDDEGLTDEDEEEEEEEEEELDAEVEEEEDEGDEEDGLIAGDMQLAASVESVPEPVQPIMHNPEAEEGPPRLSPVQEDDGGDTDLLMLVESEERETPVDGAEDGLSEAEVMSSPSPPPVLTPPPAVAAEEEEEDDTAVPDVIEREPAPEPEPPAAEEEPMKEEEEEKMRKPQVIVEEEDDIVEEEDDPEEEHRDAESMMADFIDCPPDEVDDKDPERLVT